MIPDHTLLALTRELAFRGIGARWCSAANALERGELNRCLPAWGV
jgi:hypothetical protein